MFLNALLLAIREIRRNVLRSFLTILGVVIGVAAVITLVTVGGGVTAKVKEDMSKLGSKDFQTRHLLLSPKEMNAVKSGKVVRKLLPFKPLEPTEWQGHNLILVVGKP